MSTGQGGIVLEMPDELQTFIAMFTPSRETFPGDATPEESAIVGQHFEQLKRDKESGILVLAGRTMDHFPAGLYIFRASSLEAATQRINEDAAIKAGVFKLTWVRPYSIALSGNI